MLLGKCSLRLFETLQLFTPHPARQNPHVVSVSEVSDDLARRLARKGAVGDHRRAIDDHMGHPRRIAVWGLECRGVGNGVSQRPPDQQQTV